jgi:membrane fusion protein (multidrug efflux system)
MSDIKEKTTEKNGKPENHKKPVLIGGIVLIALVAIGIGILIFWIGSWSYVTTDDAAIEGSHVSVSSKIMGRIASLGADEGSRVEKGQLLLQLDDTDLRAQESQLEASLNYTTLSMDLARINLERTKNDFDRIKTVFKSGNSTPEQYDHASKALDAANVQYSIAQAQIETARAQLGVVETQLTNTKIMAPISGIIAKRNYAPGEVIQPGQAIFLINDLKDVWIIANFEETKIRLIRPDQPADITVDAYPDFKFKGRVAILSAAIVPPPFSIGESTKTTQKVPIKILFDSIPDSAKLMPGLSVEVTIKVN